jgi:NAD-dependent DNA ligase
MGSPIFAQLNKFIVSCFQFQYSHSYCSRPRSLLILSRSISTGEGKGKGTSSQQIKNVPFVDDTQSQNQMGENVSGTASTSKKKKSKAKINPEKTIVAVTGTMSTTKRSFLDLLSSHGFKISNILHRQVDYLIAGSDALEQNTIKVRKAKKYSIPIVDEKVFFFLSFDFNSLGFFP